MFISTEKPSRRKPWEHQPISCDRAKGRDRAQVSGPTGVRSHFKQKWSKSLGDLPSHPIIPLLFKLSCNKAAGDRVLQMHFLHISIPHHFPHVRVTGNTVGGLLGGMGMEKFFKLIFERINFDQLSLNLLMLQRKTLLEILELENDKIIHMPLIFQILTQQMKHCPVLGVHGFVFR